MDYEKSNEYTLSIRLLPDGFSFSTHNVNTEESFSYQYFTLPKGNNYLSALEEEILQHEELLYPYKQIYIIVVSNRFTFIPESLYDDNNRKQYYQFNLGTGKEIILTNHLKQNHIYNVFGLDEEVYAFICRTFINCKFFHHQSILNEYFINKSRMGNCSKMFCQYREQRLDILCYSKSKLLAANSFDVSDISDATYFILFFWQRMHFDAKNDELQFIGDGTKQLIESLNPYIARIIPTVFPAQMFKLGEECLTAPFDLIALPLCV